MALPRSFGVACGLDWLAAINSVVDDAVPKLRVEYLVLLKELIETGRFKPVIDRIYPLEQLVDAHRYVDMGHKRGNVVVTVEHGNKT